MSNAYAIKYPEEVKKSKTTAEMRVHTSRPGKTDKDGNIIYFTEQAHRDRCDVNSILRKYDKNGLITHISKFEAKFGDTTGIDFKAMQDKIADAKSQFAGLPSVIRKRFEHDPAKLLQFMDDPNNREEAIKLNLIRPDWTPETDGLGEHVKLGENKIIPPVEKTEGTTPSE